MKYNWNKKELGVQKSVVGQITSIGFHFIFKGCWASNATKPDLNLSESYYVIPGWGQVTSETLLGYTLTVTEPECTLSSFLSVDIHIPIFGYIHKAEMGAKTEAALTCGFLYHHAQGLYRMANYLPLFDT